MAPDSLGRPASQTPPWIVMSVYDPKSLSGYLEVLASPLSGDLLGYEGKHPLTPPEPQMPGPHSLHGLGLRKPGSLSPSADSKFRGTPQAHPESGMKSSVLGRF